MLKGKGIKILLFIYIIFVIVSSSKVLATNSNINAYADHGAEVLDVIWSRTKEPTNNTDYINILDNKEFHSTVISEGENLSKETAEEEIFQIDNLDDEINEVNIDRQSYYTTEVIDGNTYKVINNYPSNSNKLGKVLLTPRTIYSGQTGNRILFEYNTLIALLNPKEKSNVWDGASLNRYYSGYIKDSDISNGYKVKDFATWKHYGNGDSWRLLRGDFTLDLSSSEMKNKRVYLGVLGENGPELIMPLNDFMIVLVDGKPTNINFTTQQVTDSNKDNIKFRFSDNEIYTPTFKRAYHRVAGNMRCNDPSHTSISKHTDTWHAHLNDQAELSGDGYTLGDITSFLDDGKEHKIEILCGDNTGGGGGTKLDIFLVEDPSIEVGKHGFLLDENNEKNYIREDGTSHVYPGERVYYNFTINNTGKDRLTKVEFNDELIDIKIDSTGIYRGDGTKLSNNSLSITKVSADGSKITSKGNSALKLLHTLEVGESLIVEDLDNIKYDVTLEDLERENKVIINTVVGSAKYLNNQLTAEASAGFKVYVAEYGEDIVDINKYVYEVKRNGSVIYRYNNESSISDKDVPGLYPGDEVSFIIKIKNRTIDDNRVTNTALPITNLSINDFLTLPYETPNWIFSCDEKENFDYSNFDLKANENISILATGWIVPEPYNINEDNSINIWDYNVVNTVQLYKECSDGKKELGTSAAKVKILPTKLYLKKIVVDENDNDISNDTNKSFTINIKGNDGTSFIVEAMPNEKYVINNLKYGVTYNVSEVIPANYELESIEVQDNESNMLSNGNTITLASENMESIIVVKNKLVNNKYFYDEDQETNIFTYPLRGNR